MYIIINSYSKSKSEVVVRGCSSRRVRDSDDSGSQRASVRSARPRTAIIVLVGSQEPGAASLPPTTSTTTTPPLLSCLFPHLGFTGFPTTHFSHARTVATHDTENKSIRRLPIIINLLKLFVLSSSLRCLQYFQ